MTGGTNDSASPGGNGTHPESNPLHLSDVELDKEPSSVPPPQELQTGQPAGLWVLFITEMWERFSYYGMRALLVLYLIASTAETESNPGFGWSEANAAILYAVYTWAVYLTPIFGGWLADRFLGTHRSMLIGGWIIAAGHIVLAMTEMFGITAGEAVTLQTGPGALCSFVAGLALIVIGTGFFKPCVSVMVGQLYGKDDPRRDSGFTIFYMGINLGAFLSPLIAGTLGQKVGWHWGFGSAAVGMILGLLCYQFLRPKYLSGIGLSPKEVAANGATSAAHQAELERPLTKVDTQRIAVILILALVGNIFFWAAFEQAGSSLNVFADQNTDRTIMGYEFPSTWYQSVNALTIVICAPFFSMLWVWLAKRNANPSTPMKFAWGLWFLGLAFVAMVFGALQARDGLAGPHWLLITYVLCTWGELCLSPVGLSMVTKLAPLRLQSLMMGVWFLSFSAANLLAGLMAAFSTKFKPGADGSPAEISFVIDGLPGFFLLLVLLPTVAGVLLAIVSPVLKRMMHGIK
ncbi:peptide MFS transporter [Crateriforma conspicua]|uniref:Di-/tripeptide transporter n=1 Tax=Crateriforma conspicua TaxID=2527996 RepID=A0A5C5YCA3_9PLAN|nr:peptide MFS transporter [Crateriforma conspicua]QDV61191.1 Di-/tripeptide transporter [Crateriforma conspicua]TWT72559.1 Di-/tripeptide transporter [Crateriforma conspicua]